MNKILVTGAAGFIGSEFVRQAVAKGYKPVVVDSLTYAGDRARLKECAGEITFYKADICNKRKLNEIYKKHKCSSIVHFAAETHVDRSIIESDPFIQTNIMGTQNLLDIARDYGVKRFVHVSTDEVYGDIEKGKFYEHTPLNPSSPYSASKAAADLLVLSYKRTFGLPVMIVRPSNNYGKWQYPEKFMPVIIYKALNNEKIPVYGKGLNVREWLHVSDCARGIMQVLEKGKGGEVYNLGSGHERKNIEVVRFVLEKLKKPQKLIQFVKDRPGHDIRYALSMSKLKKELGWKPQMTFNQGVEDTIEWYTTHQKWLEEKVAMLRSYWKKVYVKK